MAESLLDTLKKKLIAYRDAVTSLEMELQNKKAMLNSEEEQKTKVSIFWYTKMFFFLNFN